MDAERNKSLYSILSHEEKERDTINFRIDFIHEMLNNVDIEPLINYNDTDTVFFVDPKGNDDDKKYNNNDMRYFINKKVKNFGQIIEKMGGALSYVKSGSTGHTFRGKIQLSTDKELSGEICYAIKIVPYPKNVWKSESTNIHRPENAEILMLRLLSYFVICRQTPHIILPLGTFDTSIKNFVTFIEDGIIDPDDKKNHNYIDFVENYHKHKYHSNVSVLISEWANNGDFLNFLRKNYRSLTLIEWSVFFFQFISVLAVIQSKYPTFRHNDLKANNVLVHKIVINNIPHKYTIDDITFVVPNIGYRLKLCDFDFSCIPGIVHNDKIKAEWCNKVNINEKQNRYYDIHYFFYTLVKLFIPQIFVSSKVPVEIKEFIGRILPKRFFDDKYIEKGYICKRGRLLKNEEYLKAYDVLKLDPLFKDFRINVQNKL